MLEYFIGTTISCGLYNISKIMTMWQVFPDHQKRYFEDAFSNNQLFWCLVSKDSKDALTAICQKLAFLLDISLNHCLFFTDNLWWFEFKWSENLAQGCWPNFLGLTTKPSLPAFPWENEQHILQSHPLLTGEK